MNGNKYFGFVVGVLGFFIFINNSYASVLLDSYNQNNDYDAYIWSGSYQAFGECGTTPNDGKQYDTSSVKMSISCTAGTTGTGYYEVWPITGTCGSGATPITGSLATASIDLSTVPTYPDTTFTEISFDNPGVLQPNTSYFVIFHFNGGDSSHKCFLGTRWPYVTDSHNSTYTTDNESTWHTDSGTDPGFYLYGVEHTTGGGSGSSVSTTTPNSELDFYQILTTSFYLILYMGIIYIMIGLIYK